LVFNNSKSFLLKKYQFFFNTLKMFKVIIFVYNNNNKNNEQNKHKTYIINDNRSIFQNFDFHRKMKNKFICDNNTLGCSIYPYYPQSLGRDTPEKVARGGSKVMARLEKRTEREKGIIGKELCRFITRCRGRGQTFVAYAQIFCHQATLISQLFQIPFALLICQFGIDLQLPPSG